MMNMLVPLALPCPDLVSSCLALPTPSSSFPIPRYTPPIRTATPLANGSRVAPAATRCLNLGCLFATEPTAQRRGPADRPLCSLYATCSCRPNPTAPRIVFFFFSLFLRTMTQSSRVARVLTSVARCWQRASSASSGAPEVRLEGPAGSQEYFFSLSLKSDCFSGVGCLPVSLFCLLPISWLRFSCYRMGEVGWGCVEPLILRQLEESLLAGKAVWTNFTAYPSAVSICRRKTCRNLITKWALCFSFWTVSSISLRGRTRYRSSKDLRSEFNAIGLSSENSVF